MPLPLDTSPEAAALIEQAYREIGIEGRLRIALELSDFVHAMALAGIRERHPEYTEDQVRRELVAILYGTEAASRK